MLRIGLSGTNWTGKTETIRMVVSRHCDISIETVSLSSLVRKCPYPMEERQTLEGSCWITKQVADICNRSSGEIQIFDRTPIDILAFTLYVEDRTNIEAANVLKDIITIINNFDRLFYLPVSKEWPNNVSPSQKEIEFARQMDSYIRKAIDKFSLNVTELPWDLTKRYHLVSKLLPAKQTA